MILVQWGLDAFRIPEHQLADWLVTHVTATVLGTLLEDELPSSSSPEPCPTCLRPWSQRAREERWNAIREL